MLGEGVGDVLTPLPDEPDAAVVLIVRPPFGVSTRDRPTAGTMKRQAADAAPSTAELGAVERRRRRAEFGNDLEAPVAARHPEIRGHRRRLRGARRALAAMSGSGSACFGLFAPAADLAPLWHGLAGRHAGVATRASSPSRRTPRRTAVDRACR